MMQWSQIRITFVSPDISTATDALGRLGRAAETAATAFRKALRDVFRPAAGRDHDHKAAVRAEHLSFVRHQRRVRGLLEQELLLRSRRLGPSPSTLVPRRRPCMPRRRERRRRATRDG